MKNENTNNNQPNKNEDKQENKLLAFIKKNPFFAIGTGAFLASLVTPMLNVNPDITSFLSALSLAGNFTHLTKYAVDGFKAGRDQRKMQNPTDLKNKSIEKSNEQSKEHTNERLEAWRKQAEEGRKVCQETIKNIENQKTLNDAASDKTSVSPKKPTAMTQSSKER